MYTKEDLIRDMEVMGVDPKGTLLVHSSMKSIGEVDGGADTVLDAMMEYMKDGLLVLPTHTWDRVNREHPVFRAAEEDSCVGILTNLFRKRPGVIRSLHPTHSVAAYGKDAAGYTAGEEKQTTPCHRSGCWGRLYDRKAKILFLGCRLTSNTYLHGVEEWNGIPGTLRDYAEVYTVIAPDGTEYTVPQYRHSGGASVHYGKMEPVFLRHGALKYGTFGDARCVLCDAVGMADITKKCLEKNPRLFRCEDLPEDE